MARIAKAAVKYEFQDALKAHEFHAEAGQYGAARIEYSVANVWFVYVTRRFDAIVEKRRKKVAA